ncbi:hypothetical protein ANN_09339 [Periplaneta americana]|uniref:Uncharacterized protein n=1 Tax=Periplaneta americana TaxID=6978 RepID=A0ABQ8TNK3_PERAM|nr:hypothetical protein ANN_09339 [Periplaneta americana]
MRRWTSGAVYSVLGRDEVFLMDAEDQPVASELSLEGQGEKQDGAHAVRVSLPSQAKDGSKLASRSSTRVCVRICVSIRRSEFECSGPQLEGPEFECSGPQLEGPEFEYSELSLKVSGSRYRELEVLSNLDSTLERNIGLRISAWKIFGAKEEVQENGESYTNRTHALYSSSDIIRDIKFRRLKWAGHSTSLRRRWEDNMKMNLREVGYDDRDWINLAQDRDRWRAYEAANEPPGSLKAKEEEEEEDDDDDDDDDGRGGASSRSG